MVHVYSHQNTQICIRADCETGEPLETRYAMRRFSAGQSNAQILYSSSSLEKDFFLLQSADRSFITDSLELSLIFRHLYIPLI